MIHFIADSVAWAKQVFSRSRLPDKRLLSRLIHYASLQAENPFSTTNACCEGDKAASKGAFRFLGNPRTSDKQIVTGPTEETASVCQAIPLVLVPEDTSLIVSRRTQEVVALKEKGHHKGAPKRKVVTRRIYQHSAMAVDAESLQPIGLLYQNTWKRLEPPTNPKRSKAQKEKRRKRKNQRRKNTPYEKKESYKWERCSREIASLLPKNNWLSVCDREGDCLDYIKYKLQEEQRFVIRAAQNRSVADSEKRLFELMKESPVQGELQVKVAQRGESPAREAKLEIRARKVILTRMGRYQGKERVEVGVVRAVEIDPPEGVEGLQWLLLTSESVEVLEDSVKVVGYYKSRVMIEEVHKVEKSECGAERRTLGEDALLKLIPILTVIAIRVLQLRGLTTIDGSIRCDEVLSEVAWKCLWADENEKRKKRAKGKKRKQRRRGKNLPKRAPSLKWALEAIARLGGWTDSKNDGKIGWIVIFKGWKELRKIARGWEMSYDYNCLKSCGV